MKLTEKATAVLEATREKLMSGNVGGITEFMRWQINFPDKPMNHWSYSNRLMAYLGSGSYDCRGSKQWKEVGRWPARGSKAAFIIIPVIIKDHTNLDEEGNPKEVLVSFKSVPVFGYSSTDGAPLEQPELPKEDQLPDLYKVCEKLGIRVQYEELGTAYGCVDINATVISLANTHPSVLYHELAHAVRLKNGWYNKNDYDGEEAIAETTACVLSELFEHEDITGFTLKYLKHYLKDLDKLLSFIKQISQTLSTLLDLQGQERSEEDDL